MSQISSKTKISFVIGDPVQHSLSPLMHNAGYEALKIDDRFVFLAAHVTPQNLGTAISGMRALGVLGISVTIPHKQTVIPLLDSIDDLAKKIGAVNTIVNQKGQLRGFNTDWLGLVLPIERAGTIGGKKIAILGAGGAARAAVFGMKQKGGQVTIFNRTFERAQSLAKEFGCEAKALTVESKFSNFEIIINCTSVGMSTKTLESPIKESELGSSHIVFDCVYGHQPTKLITDARKAGATAIDGVEMLLFQGIEQFNFYTEHQAPEEAMRTALRTAIARRQ